MSCFTRVPLILHYTIFFIIILLFVEATQSPLREVRTKSVYAAQTSLPAPPLAVLSDESQRPHGQYQ